MTSFPIMHRALLIPLACLLSFAACRKKPKDGSVALADGASAAQGTERTAPVASKLADPAAAAAPLPPPGAEITVMVERRFLPAQQMNAYSPAQPGDYQAQLNLYNRVLRKRAQDLGYTPDSMQQLMASSGMPKPPQPPTGRALAYDKKTVTVSLQ